MVEKINLQEAEKTKEGWEMETLIEKEGNIQFDDGTRYGCIFRVKSNDGGYTSCPLVTCLGGISSVETHGKNVSPLAPELETKIKNTLSAAYNAGVSGGELNEIAKTLTRWSEEYQKVLDAWLASQVG
jgi:hypothetical protein